MARRSPSKPKPTADVKAAPQAALSAEPAPQPSTRRRLVALVALPLAALLLMGGLFADWYVGLPPGRVASYVGTKKCADCHPAQFADWKGSNHDRAMEPATAQTVLGDFNDRTLEHKNAKTGASYGVTSRMFNKNGKFFIHTEGPHGEMQDFEIKYTFGVAPLQQYLVEFDRGRMQALNVAWNTDQKEWFLLDIEQERIRPDDPVLGPLHWTGRALNWNHMCADCHSTNLVKGYDVESATYHTTFSEVNVACEACHGPGSIHQELAQAKSLFWDRHYGYGLAKLKGANTKAQIETCAKCHSRRHVIEANARPGDEFMDHYVPELLDTDSYHPDGQILAAEETYEYGSFLQSKMFRKGVRCSDCHNPHSAKLHAQGNALCNRCHTKSNETGVLFDSPAHHFHPAGSKGAQCVECHMPETTYMLVDPRRDHSIRIPRPDMTVALKEKYDRDVPNACNRCHKPADEKNDTPKPGVPARAKPDGDAAWAAGKITEWYGPKRQELRDKHPHFGLAIAGGRRIDPQVVNDLIKLSEPQKLEADQVGPIVRASAVRLLGQYDLPNAEAAVESALRDAEPLVRFAAITGFEIRPASERRATLAGLLEDPVRAVRFQAMRGMLDRALGPPSAEAFPRVAADYLRGAEANNDQAGSHYELAEFHMMLGEDGKMAAELQIALDLDPHYARARRMLALMLLDHKKPEAADALMREGVEKSPNSPHAHYALGDYLLDRGNVDEGTAHLAKAVEIAAKAVPVERATGGFRARYAGALTAQGKQAEALAQLEQACELDPHADLFRLELALLLCEMGDWPRARDEVQLLARRAPGNPTVRFVHGLALERIGPKDAGRKILADLPNQEVMAAFEQFANRGQRALALGAAEEVLRRDPGNRDFRGMVERLKVPPANP